MIEAMFTAVAVLVIYIAFALLALMQERHWESVTSRCDARYPAPTDRRRWRRWAASGITAGLTLCVVAHGPGFGAILWFLLLAVCALAVVFTLAWQPERLRRVAKLMSF